MLDLNHGFIVKNLRTTDKPDLHLYESLTGQKQPFRMSEVFGCKN